MLERSTQGLSAKHLGADARALAHACLLAVVKSKPEGVAKGGKRPLGGVGLGTFERKLMCLPRGRGLCLPPFLIPPAQ